MHELSITNEILEIVLRHAEIHGIRKVHTVTLEIGALSDLEPQWLQRYFSQLSAGGVAAEAELKVERIPALFLCEECGARFELDLKSEENPACPDCEGRRIRLTSGDEYLIKNMEAE